MRRSQLLRPVLGLETTIDRDHWGYVSSIEMNNRRMESQGPKEHSKRCCSSSLIRSLMTCHQSEPVEYGSNEQQMDLVLFLDGDEYEKRSVASNEAEFRQSWKRPKWHIIFNKPNVPITE